MISDVSRWFRSYGFADVDNDLLVGAYPLDKGDVEVLARLGVQHVVNLAQDAEYREGDRRRVAEALAAAGIAEERVDLVDLGAMPADQLEAAVDAVIAALDRGERVYLHCRAGRQRSAAVAAGVVAARTGIDIDQALDAVQLRKPTADPLPHQREDLRRWWAARSRPSGGSAPQETDGAGDAAGR